MVNNSARRAVVIGGSSGIGYGLATGIADAGYQVHVLSRTAPPSTENIHWTSCDLTNFDATEATLLQLAKEPIDILCFSAAFYGPKRRTLAATPVREWTTQVDIMLHGLWIALHTCLPALTVNAPGLIVGVSSEVIYNLGPGRSGHAAVKAAASTLIRSVAQEFTPDTLRIVEVLPQGMVDSPGIRARRSSDFDYSGYMQAQDFRSVGRYLATTRGSEVHGLALEVRAGGEWQSVMRGALPPSQSTIS